MEKRSVRNNLLQEEQECTYGGLIAPSIMAIAIILIIWAWGGFSLAQ